MAQKMQLAGGRRMPCDTATRKCCHKDQGVPLDCGVSGMEDRWVGGRHIKGLLPYCQALNIMDLFF